MEVKVAGSLKDNAINVDSIVAASGM